MTTGVATGSAWCGFGCWLGRFGRSRRRLCRWRFASGVGRRARSVRRRAGSRLVTGFVPVGWPMVGDEVVAVGGFGCRRRLGQRAGSSGVSVGVGHGVPVRVGRWVVDRCRWRFGVGSVGRGLVGWDRGLGAAPDFGRGPAAGASDLRGGLVGLGREVGRSGFGIDGVGRRLDAEHRGHLWKCRRQAGDRRAQLVGDGRRWSARCDMCPDRREGRGLEDRRTTVPRRRSA